MSRKLCLSLFFSLIFVISGIILMQLIISTWNDQLMNPVDRVRLIIFMAQHVFTIIMLLNMWEPQDSLGFTKWNLWLSGVNSHSFLLAEVAFLLTGEQFFDFKPDAHSARINMVIMQMDIYFYFSTYFGIFFAIAALGYYIMLAQTRDRPRAYEEVIAQLQSQQYKSESSKDCSICLNPLSHGRVYKLKCLHQFHNQCLKQWLKLNTICPLCRISLSSRAANTAQSSSPQRIVRQFGPSSSVPVISANRENQNS